MKGIERYADVIRWHGEDRLINKPTPEESVKKKDFGPEKIVTIAKLMSYFMLGQINFNVKMIATTNSYSE
jgi:hypothetical protein